MKQDPNKLGTSISKESGEMAFTQAAPVQETRNTMLAAALIAFGIRLAENSGGGILTGDNKLIAPGGSITWCFETTSPDGTYNTSELMNLWQNRAWLTDPDNEHPFAYIACAFHNYKRLIDHIKQSVPIGLLRNGKKMALVRLDAPDAFVGVIEKVLNKR